MELLVAIVLIDIGVLSLVAESAVLVTRRNEMRVRALAARVASDRLATLSALTCAPTMGAGTTPAGMRESWNVTLMSNAVRDVRDSVAFEVGRDTGAVVLRTRLPC